MGRCIIALAIILAFINPLQAQELSTAIKFDERVFNFGTILEKNGKVTHVFTFHNEENTPVAITEINSGCGCIGNVVSKDPVKPGGTGKITITFNPEYKSGFFSKEILVFSKGGQEYSRIWVEGNITPSEHPIEDDYPYNFGEGLYLKFKVMAFGYVKPGQTKQMELQYANATNKEMDLQFIVAGSQTGLSFKSPGKIPPKGKGTVIFSYSMPLISNEDAIFSLYPSVNNKKLKTRLEIKILNEKKLKQKPVAIPGQQYVIKLHYDEN